MDSHTQIVRGEILAFEPRPGGFVELKLGGAVPMERKPTIQQVADHFGKSVETIKRWCKEKKIPHYNSADIGIHFDWQTLRDWEKKDFVPAKA